MAWAVTQSGFATDLATMLGAAPGGPAGFLAISVLVFAILGSVLEGIPAIVLFGPLLFPIARELGINEVHYAIVAVLAMGIGLFSPPLGVGYYAACAIGKTEPEAAMPRLAPYLLAILAATVLVAAFPDLTVGR
jgi:TRAP-type C4-dicarboxylate transport system permease large subunit